MIRMTSRLRRVLRRSRAGVTCDRRYSIAVCVAEAVADAAHGEQVLRVLRVGLELLAQVPDVDIDGAGVAVCRVAPDVFEQHFPGEHAARGARKGRQDLELDIGELHGLSAQLHGPALEVDLELR